MISSYEDFLAQKARVSPLTGIADPKDLSEHLFPFQADLVRWALRRGRAAIFADTGLGKTRMQLVWAHVVNRHLATTAQVARVLVLAPLAVAAQTVAEGARIGIDVRYCRAQSDITDGITITNYDMLDKFDPSLFGAVVLDESSILKNFDGRTRTQIIDGFRATPFKLACTATPSPNDFTELGNHAEFLGVMSRVEMLASFFVHDGGSVQDWRLKGHARDAFWRWVCSWGALIKLPSDLGYGDAGYTLPELRVLPHVVPSTIDQAREQGLLFATAARTLNEQRAARRASMTARVDIAARLAAKAIEPWVMWCELNAESEALAKAIPGAVEVCGNDSADEKKDRLEAFSRGAIRVLVTKPSIAGFGMNWQHCAHTAFVGVGHSHEMFYQAVRRFWRFGQTRPVEAHIITSEIEGEVVANLQRKERDATVMAEEMRRHTAAFVRANVGGAQRDTTMYRVRRTSIPAWLQEDS